MATHEVAKLVGCSRSWARRVKQNRNKFGFIFRPRTRHRTPRWKLELDADEIEKLLAADPFMTLQQLKEALDTELSLSTLSRALAALELTRSERFDW